MIGNKLEQSIITVFQKNPSTTYSINQLAKSLGKAYPYINHKINFFIKEGVLNTLAIGNSHQCFLNYHNEKTRILLSLNALAEKESFLALHPSYRALLNALEHFMLSRAKPFPIECIALHTEKKHSRILLVYSSLTITPDDVALIVKECAALSKQYSCTVECIHQTQYTQFLLNKSEHEQLIILKNSTRHFELFAEVSDTYMMKGLLAKKTIIQERANTLKHL